MVSGGAYLTAACGGPPAAGGAYAAAPPPEHTLPPPAALKYADTSTVLGGGSGSGSGGGGGGGDLAALLLEVSLELGYTEADIEAFCASGDIPDDVVKEVMGRTGAPDIAAARASCRSQAPRTRVIMAQAIALRAAAQQAAVQEKLQRIGKCCMGFE